MLIPLPYTITTPTAAAVVGVCAFPILSVRLASVKGNRTRPSSSKRAGHIHTVTPSSSFAAFEARWFSSHRVLPCDHQGRQTRKKIKRRQRDSKRCLRAGYNTPRLSPERVSKTPIPMPNIQGRSRHPARSGRGRG